LSNVSIANTTLWGNVNGRRGPIYTPTPTPEPPQVVPNDINEGSYQVRLDAARLGVQCGIAAVMAFGLLVFGHKSEG
jgi:hypothetical protein